MITAAFISIKKGEYKKVRKAHLPLRIVKRILLTVMIASSLFYTVLAMNPGTYAWFTSETYAKGTIVNATTADLLTIEPTALKYGANCSVKSSMTVTNISSLDTNVRVFLLTDDGEKLVKEQELKSGKTLTTEPTEVGRKVAKSCSQENVTYRVDAFIEFVSEEVVVPVDPQLLQPEKPRKKREDSGKQEEKDSKAEVEPVTEPETESDTQQETETETEQTPVSQDSTTPNSDSTKAESVEP